MSQCGHVKWGLAQYSCGQCVTKAEGGPACVETPGGLSHGVKSGERGVGCGDAPRLPSCTQSPGEMRHMNNPTFESDPNTSLRKWMLLNNE